MQGDVDNPKVAMENNFRSIQPLNQRSIRTNINFHNSASRLRHLLFIKPWLHVENIAKMYYGILHVA